MRTVLATNDPVLLSLAVAVLRDAGIEATVFDTHMAALDGSIGAIPRRVCVLPHEEARARALVEALEADGRG